MLTQYSATTLSGIPEKIHEHGIAIMDNFLADSVIQSLAAEIQHLSGQMHMKAAATGREHQAIVPTLRGDQIHWLDEQTASPAQQIYFAKMEQVRQGLNEQLYLGLHTLESHLALYTPGMRYQKHIDRFKTQNAGLPLRQISCILYLNPEWHESNGGHLRLYLSHEDTDSPEVMDVLPEGGRAIFFLSDTFYHEVLPANQDRMSLTGWFLTR